MFEVTITDKWIDTQGNIWYKAHKICEPNYTTCSEYGKITDSGNTYESVNHFGDQPIENWEPDNPDYHYAIYYRE